MEHDYVQTGVGLLTAIVIVAIIAVIVKKGSLTTQFLQTFGNAFSTLVGRAVGPVSGVGTGLVSSPWVISQGIAS